MRVIDKNTLVQLISQCNSQYISKQKLLHWLMIHGTDLETKEENKEEEHAN